MRLFYFKLYLSTITHFHKTDVMNFDGIKHRLLNVNELWEERD
jgi:hypothetical protein